MKSTIGEIQQWRNSAKETINPVGSNLWEIKKSGNYPELKMLHEKSYPEEMGGFGDQADHSTEQTTTIWPPNLPIIHPTCSCCCSSNQSFNQITCYWHYLVPPLWVLIYHSLNLSPTHPDCKSFIQLVIHSFNYPDIYLTNLLLWLTIQKPYQNLHKMVGISSILCPKD